MLQGLQSNAFSYSQFVWFIGVVEDRDDPEKTGRLKVRIFGYHDEEDSENSSSEISKDSLVWAATMQPTTSAALSGIGHSPTGIMVGTTVVGFFADGHSAEMPIIMGTLTGKPTKTSQTKTKYEDGESDANRLARGETKETSIEKQNDSLTEGDGWKEPKSAYAAKYPYNHIIETECGHIQEFDDTDGAERIRIYHKNGTFWEIHPGGDYVLKIQGTQYEIIKTDSNVKIGGNLNVEVTGDVKLKVNGKVDCQVVGNITVKSDGDIAMTATGDFDIKCGGNATIQSGSSMKLESGGNTSIDAGGMCSINGSMVTIN